MSKNDIFDNYLIEINRFEIILIKDNNRTTIDTTNDLEYATLCYENCIKKYTELFENHHIIIALYDYNKNANINYFDNELDLD